MLPNLIIFCFFVGGVFLLFAGCAFYAEWQERREWREWERDFNDR